MDTVVFVATPDSEKPPLGDYLGDLTNEIDKGEHTTEFVCGGHKNNAYTVSNGKQHCKIRGFTLNFKNSLLLNFDSLKEMIYNYVEKPSNVEIEECKIVREKWSGKLVNRN